MYSEVSFISLKRYGETCGLVGLYFQPIKVCVLNMYVASSRKRSGGQLNDDTQSRGKKTHENKTLV